MASFAGTAQASTAHYRWGAPLAVEKANGALVYTAFAPFGDYVASCMVKIMHRESGGNPLASNFSDSNGGSYGLLQLNGVHRWRGETLSQFRARMYNVKTHLEAAVRLYRGSGISKPWGYCPRG